MIMSDLAIINDYLLFELKALPAECFSTHLMQYVTFYIHPCHSQLPRQFLTTYRLKKYIRFLNEDQIDRLCWIYDHVLDDPSDSKYFNCTVMFPMVPSVYDDDLIQDQRCPSSGIVVKFMQLYGGFCDWESNFCNLVIELPECFAMNEDWRLSLKNYTAEAFLEMDPDSPQLWYTFFDCNIKTSRVADIYSYHFLLNRGQHGLEHMKFETRHGYERSLLTAEEQEPAFDIEEDELMLQRMEEAEWMDLIVDNAIKDMVFAPKYPKFKGKLPPLPLWSCEVAGSFTKDENYSDESHCLDRVIVNEKDVCSEDESTDSDEIGILSDEVVNYDDPVTVAKNWLLGTVYRVPTILPNIPKRPDDAKTPMERLEEEEFLLELRESVANNQEEKVYQAMIIEEQLDEIVGVSSWWDKAKNGLSNVAAKLEEDFKRVSTDTAHRCRVAGRRIDGTLADIRGAIDSGVNEVSDRIGDVVSSASIAIQPMVVGVSNLVDRQVAVANRCIQCGGGGGCNCKIQDFTAGNIEGQVLADQINHAVKFVERSVSNVSVLDGIIEHSTQDIDDLVKHNVVGYGPHIPVLSEPRIEVPRPPDPNPNQVDDFIIQPHKWSPAFSNVTDEQLSYVCETFQKVIYNLNRNPLDIETKLAFLNTLTRDYQPIFVTCQRTNVMPIVLAHEDQDMRPVNMNSSKPTVKAKNLEKFMVTTTSIRILNRLFAYPKIAEQILNNMTTGSVIDLGSVCEVVVDTVELVSCPAIVISVSNSKVFNMTATSDVVRRSAEIAVNQMHAVNLPAGLAYSDGRSVYDDSISMICHTRECRKWFRYGPNCFPRL